MTVDQLTKGKYVTIMSTMVTSITHGANTKMKKMVGRQYKIDDVFCSATHGGKSAYINGFNWCPEDLGVIKPKKTPKPTKFNPEELVL